MPEGKAGEIADALSKALDSQHSWYIDFKNDKTHYIIFLNKVFTVNRRNKASHERAKEYGIKLGIPGYQLDFSPDVMV